MEPAKRFQKAWKFVLAVQKHAMRRKERIHISRQEFWSASKLAASIGIPKKRFIACLKKYGAAKTINFLRGIRKLSLAMRIPPKEVREMLKKRTIAGVFSQLQQEYEQQQVVRGA